jgi:hypothetical protein
MRASTAIGQIAQNAQAIPGLDMSGVATFTFNAVGLDTDGLMKSEEQMAQEQAQEQAMVQQQQQAEMMKGAMSGTGSAVVNGAMNNPENASQVIESVQGAMQQ